MVDIEEAFVRAREKAKSDYSSFQEKVGSISQFFSDEMIDQTSNTTDENEEGIAAEEAYNDFLLNHLGFTDRVSEKTVERKMAISPSREGKGREGFIKIFQGAQLEEDEKHPDLTSRVMR